MENLFLNLLEGHMPTLWFFVILALIFTAFAQTLFQHNMAGLALVVYYMLAAFATGFTFLFFLSEQHILMVTGIALTIFYVFQVFNVIIVKADEEEEEELTN